MKTKLYITFNYKYFRLIKRAAARAKKEAPSGSNTLNKNERGALWPAPLKPRRRHNKGFLDVLDRPI